jgi:hypothetical protein
MQVDYSFEPLDIAGESLVDCKGKCMHRHRHCPPWRFGHGAGVAGRKPAHSRGSVNVLVQSPKLSLEAIATEAFSSRSLHLEEQFSAAAVEFHVARFLSQEST